MENVNHLKNVLVDTLTLETHKKYNIEQDNIRNFLHINYGDAICNFLLLIVDKPLYDINYDNLKEALEVKLNKEYKPKPVKQKKVLTPEEKAQKKLMNAHKQKEKKEKPVENKPKREIKKKNPNLLNVNICLETEE